MTRDQPCINDIGTGETRAAQTLAPEIKEQGLIDLQTWMTDRGPRYSSLIQRSKKGPDEPADRTLGRSRGGLTIKIHILCDTNGTALLFLLSDGQASEISYAQPLLNEVSIPSSQRGHPCCAANGYSRKGYDAQALRRYYDQYRMQPVIPMRSMKRKPNPGLPKLSDWPKYRQRNTIERIYVFRLEPSCSAALPRTYSEYSDNLEKLSNQLKLTRK